MKVLILAFACEPGRTSEPGVGWHVASEMALRHDVTLITRANNQAVIETFMAQHPEAPIRRVRFLYYDLAAWMCCAKRRMPYGSQIYHELWQRKVARQFRPEIEKADVVHQLTFGAAFFTPYAAPHAKRFVWGPLGGGDRPIEWQFLRKMGWRSILSEMLYGRVSYCAVKGLPWVKRYRAAVGAVIFRSNEFAKRMKDRLTIPHAVIQETAYEDHVYPRTYTAAQHPIKVLEVGRLIPHKGVSFAVRVFALFLSRGGEGEFVLCGDGDLRQLIEEQARELGVSEYVRFRGQVEHNVVMEEMESADVLLHLSFREGGSWSILEAMAHGVPVICQERSGMEVMVSPDCGTRIAATNGDELVEYAATALMDYYQHPEKVAAQGKVAQSRVETVYRWNLNVDQIEKMYLQVK